MNDRAARIGEEIKKEISDILKNDIKDPRLPMMLSITGVDVSRDMSHAKIFYSVMCDDAQKKEANKALLSASGYIRRELGHRIKLRRTPELHFTPDDSIERTVTMNKLIDDTIKQDMAKRSNYAENSDEF